MLQDSVVSTPSVKPSSEGTVGDSLPASEAVAFTVRCFPQLLTVCAWGLPPRLGLEMLFCSVIFPTQPMLSKYLLKDVKQNTEQYQ